MVTRLSRRRPPTPVWPIRNNGHRPVHYPSSDGKPMAESDLHRDEIVRLIETLQAVFADDADVYVSGDLLCYDEEGNPRRSVAPDVFIVRGVPKHRREIFKYWDEDGSPTFVIEVTSKSTSKEDEIRKRLLYARLGVRELFLYDPLAEYLAPSFQGFRLAGDDYLPIPPDAEGGLVSEEVGLRLVLRDGLLRLVDPVTGAVRLSPAERTALAEERAAAEVDAHIEAEERAEAERQAREAETAARREAEARAAEDRAARTAAEARAAEAERLLAQLLAERREQP